VVVAFYGKASRTGTDPERSIKVALIQHSFNTRFEFDPQRNNRVFRAYRDLTLETCERHPDLDLVVWPESVFTANLAELIVEGPMPGDDPSSQVQLEQHAALFEGRIRDAADALNQVWIDGRREPRNISLLIGTETFVAGPTPRLHNTALLIDPQGKIAQRYYKMHPVMFGEYIPLAKWIPWLYTVTPMSQGLTPGLRPSCFEVQGVRISPSICFESTVPHLIRSQLLRLEQEGTPPDVLANVTHDGWFWGSAILDLQLACAVFRAVELRKPMLVAANAGISAWIDREGRIVKRAPRQGSAVLIARIGPSDRSSLYARHGDVFAGGCLVACLVGTFAAWAGVGMPNREFPVAVGRAPVGELSS
jgi:apolipoprotein N-acyltransferase